MKLQTATYVLDYSGTVGGLNEVHMVGVHACVGAPAATSSLSALMHEHEHGLAWLVPPNLASSPLHPIHPPHTTQTLYSKFMQKEHMDILQLELGIIMQKRYSSS